MALQHQFRKCHVKNNMTLGKSNPSFPIYSTKCKWILLNSNPNYLFFIKQGEKWFILQQTFLIYS